MVKRIFLIIIVSIKCFSNTIVDDIETAISNHPIIKIREYESLIAKNKEKIAESAFYPEINISMNMGNENKEIKSLTDNSTINEKFKNGRHVELSFKQNLFNGNADIGNVKKSKVEYVISKLKKDSEIDKLSMDIIKVYIEILRMRDLINYNKNSIDKYESYLKKAEIESELTGVKSGTLNLKIKYLKIKSEQIKLKIELKKMEGRYVQLVGKTPSEKMKLFVLNKSNFSENELLEQLDSKNNDLQILTKNQKYLQAENRVLKANYYPKIDLELKRYQDKDIEYLEKTTNQDSVMFNLKYNIFNGWADSNKIQNNILEQKKSKEEYEKKYNEQIEIIKSLYSKNQSSSAHIEILLKYINNQKKLVNLYLKSFELGNLNLFNLVESEQNLIDMTSNYINHLYDYILSSYQIEYELGGIYMTVKNRGLKEVSSELIVYK